MPQIITELPIIEKLPETLYDGCFELSLVHEPSQPPHDALYMFHDHVWFADLRHMLGWSREIIHSLSYKDMRHPLTGKPMMPEWLCGVSFKWRGDIYTASGSGKGFEIQDLLKCAQAAQQSLEDADIHTDQWGAKAHEDWHDAISDHLKKRILAGKNGVNPIIDDVRKLARHDLEMHTLLANWGNATHHPEYRGRD